MEFVFQLGKLEKSRIVDFPRFSRKDNAFRKCSGNTSLPVLYTRQYVLFAPRSFVTIPLSPMHYCTLDICDITHCQWTLRYRASCWRSCCATASVCVTLNFIFPLSFSHSILREKLAQRWLIFDAVLFRQFAQK